MSFIGLNELNAICNLCSGPSICMGLIQCLVKSVHLRWQLIFLGSANVHAEHVCPSISSRHKHLPRTDKIDWCQISIGLRRIRTIWCDSNRWTPLADSADRHSDCNQSNCAGFNRSYKDGRQTCVKQLPYS